MKEMVKRQAIGTPGASPYSPAVRFGNLLFVAGQTGRDPKTGKPALGGIEAEVRQALENLKGVLEMAGAKLSDVLKATCYITDFGNFERMNNVYREYFPAEPPSRATVQVGGLAQGALFEIEVIAGFGE